MPGSYVAFDLLPSDPFDLLASCIVSLTQRINKYVCMYNIMNMQNSLLLPPPPLPVLLGSLRSSTRWQRKGHKICIFNEQKQ